MHAGGDYLSVRMIRKDKSLNYVLGVVYEPNKEDLQGDYMTADEVRKAAWNFMRNLGGRDVEKGIADKLIEAFESQKDIYVDVDALRELQEEVVKMVGAMHDEKGAHVGKIVESYIAPQNMQIGDEVVVKGTWLMGIQFSDAHYQKVLSGEWTGLSMGGYARVLEEVIEEDAEE